MSNTKKHAKRRADRLIEQLTEGTENQTPAQRHSSAVFGRRLDALSEIGSGKRHRKIEYRTQLLVDPNECLPWDLHNRDYANLNEENCADLIQAFRESGKQEFPAVVREAPAETGKRYEIICGVRRHWVAKHLGWDYLVEVVDDLDDENAFILSDVENRARKDLSDYERALDYRKALDRFFRTQKEMAQRLGCSQSWLSTLLFLADLPKPVLDACRNPHELSAAKMYSLRPMLKDQKKKRAILDRMRSLIAENRKLPANALLAEIRKAAEKAPVKPGTLVYQNLAGEVLVKASLNRSGKELKLQVNLEGDEEDLRKAFDRALREAKERVQGKGVDREVETD